MKYNAFTMEARLDKSQLVIVDSFAEADEQDRQYWWSRTPAERIHHLEELRRLNYGDEPFKRLQRVFEIAWRE